MTHGIGRSGELTAQQPKAAGSSLLAALVNHLLLHAIKLSGALHTAQALCVPMCTGMTLSLVMTTLKMQKSTAGKYVVWCRIDQQSVLKSIQTAGLQPLVIHGQLTCEKQAATSEQQQDAIETNLTALQQALQQYQEEIVCVLTTTSCFAPRLPDRIVDVSKLCKTYNVPHIVNNAYGIQCKSIMNQINTCMSQPDKYRLDCFVQSTDKNFLVPIGGAVRLWLSDYIIF